MTGYADPELAVRDYLRSHPAIVANGAGIFLHEPKPHRFLVWTDIYQVMTDMDPNAPVEAASLTVNVWGQKDVSRAVVSQTVGAIKVAALAAATTKVASGVVVDSLTVTNVLWLPDLTDPENRIARYVMELVARVRSE